MNRRRFIQALCLMPFVEPLRKLADILPAPPLKVPLGNRSLWLLDNFGLHVDFATRDLLISAHDMRLGLGMGHPNCRCDIGSTIE